jgi:hypothetical protein
MRLVLIDVYTLSVGNLVDVFDIVVINLRH